MRVVLLTTCIAVWVAGAAMLTLDLSVYRKSWASELSDEAAILARSTAPALEFDDHAVAERNLAALQARPQVLVAAIYSANGRIYASYVRPGTSAPPPAAPVPGLRMPASASNWRNRYSATARLWASFTSRRVTTSSAA